MITYLIKFREKIISSRKNDYTLLRVYLKVHPNLDLRCSLPPIQVLARSSYRFLFPLSKYVFLFWFSLFFILLLYLAMISLLCFRFKNILVSKCIIIVKNLTCTWLVGLFPRHLQIIISQMFPSVILSTSSRVRPQ